MINIDEETWSKLWDFLLSIESIDNAPYGLDNAEASAWIYGFDSAKDKIAALLVDNAEASAWIYGFDSAKDKIAALLGGRK